MKYFLLVLTFLLMSCENNGTKVLTQEQKVITSSQEFAGKQIETPNVPRDGEMDKSLEVEETTSEGNCIAFDDFSGDSEYQWGVVNDWVMWGKSRGFLSYEDEKMIFSGTIVTRWWGFSSLRGRLGSGVLSDYSSVKLKAKSDGREYRITFRDDRWGNISHRTIIPFQDSGEFEDIEIAFTDLVPASFGRAVDVEPFKKESAREMGVILSDGVDWEFRLEIEEVRFCKQGVI